MEQKPQNGLEKRLIEIVQGINEFKFGNLVKGIRASFEIFMARTSQSKFRRVLLFI